jgi:hypothetical protein
MKLIIHFFMGGKNFILELEKKGLKQNNYKDKFEIYTYLYIRQSFSTSFIWTLDSCIK